MFASGARARITRTPEPLCPSAASCRTPVTIHDPPAGGSLVVIRLTPSGGAGTALRHGTGWTLVTTISGQEHHAPSSLPAMRVGGRLHRHATLGVECPPIVSVPAILQGTPAAGNRSQCTGRRSVAAAGSASRRCVWCRHARDKNSLLGDSSCPRDMIAVRASVCPKIWERHFATHSSQINNKHLQCLSTRKFTRSGPFSLVFGQILARRSEGSFKVYASLGYNGSMR